jgi:hypothetical protein
MGVAFGVAAGEMVQPFQMIMHKNPAVGAQYAGFLVRFIASLLVGKIQRLYLIAQYMKPLQAVVNPDPRLVFVQNSLR